MARIMMVEDDDAQREIRKQILEHAGHEVIAAQDAREALERWTNCDRLTNCPVVVMDLSIPATEDGLRLIQAIAGKTTIIVLSGRVQDRPLPVNEFLTKPCSSKKLLASIEKWTSESR
jgi:two-component system, cell cycle sensor histidine kinase and response regulator CckA